MRTDQEIADHIRSIEKADFFGFTTSDLLAYLPFAAAKEFLKPEATDEKWKVTPRDRDSVLAQMLDYMPFAWGKANDCRGLSAVRSLNHMQAWLWMAGETDAAAELDDYSHYGKPQLRAICEKFGWDWRQWDDGRWRNDESSDGCKPEGIDPPAIRWAA